MLTEQQHKIRQQGIGASETAIILGLNPFQSAYDLWRLKTGQSEPKDLSENEAIWWGNALEPVIADRYAFETGYELIADPTTYFSEECSYMLCHPDRFIKGHNKIVEVKTAWYSSEKWGEIGSDQVPIEYTLQVQHQLDCVGFDEADLVVFFKNTARIAIYTIKRDDKLISDIRFAVKRFWEENVLKKISPPLSTLSDVQVHYSKNIFDDSVEASNSALKAVADYRVARDSESKMKEIKEECQKILCEEIGSYSGIKFGDQILCTWKANKSGSRRFSVKDDKEGK